MLAHSLKTYFPTAPRPAGDIAPHDFAKYVNKYPKVAAHISLACTARHAAFLRYLWKGFYLSPSDRAFVLTCDFIAKSAMLFRFIDLEDDDVKTEFFLIYNAINYGMRHK